MQQIVGIKNSFGKSLLITLKGCLLRHFKIWYYLTKYLTNNIIVNCNLSKNTYIALKEIYKSKKSL